MTFAERRRAFTWSMLVLLLASLAACGPTQVVVQGNFPRPLIKPLPLTLGLWYGDDFAQHEFFDESRGKEESDWIVTTGSAQVDMWNTLLAGMFTRVVHLKQEPGAGHTVPAVDAVLVPHVDELQYALPIHTNIKVYEIWMRYRFELLQPDGSTIAQWTMSSYGKTPTAFLQTDQEAVNLAAVMALRDAGANFAANFKEVPGVREWLEQKGLQSGKASP